MWRLLGQDWQWRLLNDQAIATDDDAEAGGGSGGVVFVSRSTRFSQMVLSLFLTIWFACGNFWVFRVYRKVGYVI